MRRAYRLPFQTTLDPSHRAACFRAGSAGVAARAAMVGGMASAFVCARIANTGAQIAKIAHELRLARERLRREAAQRRAVQIEADALFHFGKLPFGDARGRALGARRRAAVERADRIDEFAHIQFLVVKSVAG